MKRIIIVLMFCIIASLVSSSLDTDYKLCYDFNANQSPIIGTTTLGGDAFLSAEDCKAGDQFGRCMKFDGSQRLQNSSSSDIDLRTNFTMSMWFNVSSNNGYIFGKNAPDSYQYIALYTIASDNNLRTYMGNGAGNTPHDGAVTLNLNQWYHLVTVYNGTRVRTYIDNVTIVNEAETSDSGVLGGFLFGARFDTNYISYTGYATGRLDEIKFWERALSPEEVLQLSALSCNVTKSISPVTIVNVFLTDKNNLTLEEDNIKESDEFFINANATLSRINVSGLICNFTSENITAHFSFESGENITLNGTSQVEVIINEGTLNLTEDTIEFEVCRTNAIRDAQIFQNGTLFRTVDGNVIPKCTGGSHQVLNQTTAFINQSGLNITVKCDLCSVANNLIIISDELDETLHFERTFTTHSEPLTFNTINGIYTFSGHLYEYKSVFQANISVLCNDTFGSISFNLLDVAPIIDILTIDDVPYIDGINVESNVSTIILIDVYGDVITFINFSVIHPNGSLIRNVSTVLMNLSLEQLNIDGTYNISIFAEDDDGNTSTLNGFFILNDTISPSIDFTVPLEDNSTITIQNQSLGLIAQFSDINLFAYEVLVYNNIGQLVFNFSANDLTSSTFDFSESIVPNRTGFWRIDTTVADSHTDLLIGDYNYQKIDNKLIYTFEKIRKKMYSSSNVSIDYVGKFNVVDVTTKKQEDRYNFVYEFTNDIELIKENVQHKFKIECDDLYFIDESKYTAHFVCWEAKKWVDFTHPDIQSFYIEPCNKDCYTVTLTMPSYSSVEFSSIGGLNEINESLSFEVLPIPPIAPFLGFGLDLSLVSHVILIFSFVILYIGLMGLGFAFKNFGFASFGFIVGVVLGLLFVQIHIFMFLMFTLTNIAIFIKYTISMN